MKGELKEQRDITSAFHFIISIELMKVGLDTPT